MSTKVLSRELVQLMESTGLKVTCSDFIKKTIKIPNDLDQYVIQNTIVLTSVTSVKAWIEIGMQLKLDMKQFSIYCLSSATQTIAIDNGLNIAGVASDGSSLACSRPESLVKMVIHHYKN